MQLDKLAAKLAQEGNLELPQMALVYGAPLSGKTSLVAQFARKYLSLIHISEPTRRTERSRMPSSA